MERHSKPENAKSHEEALFLAALSYSRQGFPVLPLHHPLRGGICSCGRGQCPSPGKHPVTKHGVLDATTKEPIVRDWWQRFPESNIGLSTGSHPVVLDVDPRHGGDASLVALARRFGHLPETRTVLTGGGGRHYYLQSETPLKSTVRLAGLDGLDIRGQGAYVVAPPSRHISGAIYRLEDISIPSARAPRWLTELLSEQTNQASQRRSPHPGSLKRLAPDDLFRWAIDRAVPGNRNETGFLLACRLRDQGIDEQDARQILSDYASQVSRTSEPYTVYEALASLRQAYKHR
jgi:Bifunctional DNA primase/polymerase, N-terminal